MSPTVTPNKFLSRINLLHLSSPSPPFTIYADILKSMDGFSPGQNVRLPSKMLPPSHFPSTPFLFCFRPPSSVKEGLFVPLSHQIKPNFDLFRKKFNFSLSPQLVGFFPSMCMNSLNFPFSEIEFLFPKLALWYDVLPFLPQLGGGEIPGPLHAPLLYPY